MFLKLPYTIFDNESALGIVNVHYVNIIPSNMGTFKQIFFRHLKNKSRIVASKCEYSWIADIVKQNWRDFITVVIKLIDTGNSNTRRRRKRLIYEFDWRHKIISCEAGVC